MRNLARSLSSSPIESQAAGGASAGSASHSATSVVLPNPTGAETRVNARLRLAFSRSVRRARATMLARTLGWRSFIASSGAWPNGVAAEVSNSVMPPLYTLSVKDDTRWTWCEARTAVVASLVRATTGFPLHDRL